MIKEWYDPSNDLNVHWKRLKCYDKQPPHMYLYRTCRDQLHYTQNCKSRREGLNMDGLCAQTCGLCTSKETDKAILKDSMG